jgi:hypothetical protein
MATREWEILRCDLARPHLKMIIIIIIIIIIVITRSFVP